MIGSKSEVHCGSAVRIGQTFLGFLITAHYLCTFLLYLEGLLCMTPKKVDPVQYCLNGNGKDLVSLV